MGSRASEEGKSWAIQIKSHKEKSIPQEIIESKNRRRNESREEFSNPQSHHPVKRFSVCQQCRQKPPLQHLIKLHRRIFYIQISRQHNTLAGTFRDADSIAFRDG